jgi:hypothetical protein
MWFAKVTFSGLFHFGYFPSNYFRIRVLRAVATSTTSAGAEQLSRFFFLTNLPLAGDLGWLSRTSQTTGIAEQD